MTSRYLKWSFEELRHLAQQLQVPDAAEKSRKELLDLLVDGAAREAPQNLERPARQTGDGELPGSMSRKMAQTGGSPAPS